MNKYWDRITEIAQKQTEKGLVKYGNGLESNVCMDVLERIQMIEEELVDALFYLEHLKANSCGEAHHEIHNPKKPNIKEQDLGIFGKTHGFVCSCCEASLRYRYEYKEPIDLYCWKCGQAIDWSEIEE